MPINVFVLYVAECKQTQKREAAGAREESAEGESERPSH